jgi:hypothetical protein
MGNARSVRRRKMIEPKMLIDAGICCSFAQARRMISGMPESKILDLLKDKEKWGKRPHRSSYNMFSIKGDFSSDFIKSMGLKKVEMPLFDVGKNYKIAPMEPVGLAFTKKFLHKESEIKKNLILIFEFIAGWSSQVACWAHNPNYHRGVAQSGEHRAVNSEVAGSKPVAPVFFQTSLPNIPGNFKETQQLILSIHEEKKLLKKTSKI